jgi:hypothetical protein
MTSSTIDDSQRKAAKVAGFAYLFTLAAVVFSQFRIHDRLMVGNAAETARNIMAHERLFRIGIACDLTYCAGVVILLTALYVILKPVNPGFALLAAFWRLAYAFVWILMTLNLFDARRLLSGADYSRVFEAANLDFALVFPGLSEIIGKLHPQPRFRRAAERLREPDRNLGADPHKR